MSYITYIASARPLPVGKWETAPKRVYASYAQYAKSPDFILKWKPGGRFKTPEAQIQHNCRYKGKVAVYSDRPDYISVEPFEEWEFTQGQFVTLRNLRKHLKLPEVYFVDGALRPYLRWALRPGEQVEFLCCWNGEENKRITEPVSTIDLQLPDGEPDLSLIGKGNYKMIFLAPDEPQPFALTPIKEDYIMSIWPDCPFEMWDMAERLKQDKGWL